ISTSTERSLHLRRKHHLHHHLHQHGASDEAWSGTPPVARREAVRCDAAQRLLLSLQLPGRCLAFCPTASVAGAAEAEAGEPGRTEAVAGPAAVKSCLLSSPVLPSPL